MMEAARPTGADVLVVDDIAANRELLAAHLESMGHRVREAADGIEALEAVDEREPDLILLDIDMPRLDGIAVCSRLKRDPARRLIPIVILTSHDERDVRLRGLAAGADDYLTKPVDADALRVRAGVLLRERALNKHLDAAESVVLALARIVEARDRYTIHHAERVGRYAEALGRALGAPEETLDVLYRGGVLHDLGKIIVPSEILLKTGPLGNEERLIMEHHSPEGARLCGSLRSVSLMLPIIRHHHERIDGTGYPDHLAGAEIPFGGRIAAICDSWDAMTSDRPYRIGLETDEALSRLRAGAGTQWDPEGVEAFITLVEDGIVERVAAAATLV